jgi:predicted amidohydrolase
VSGVTVACCQLAPRIGELKRNRAEARRAIVDAASRGASIIVLPELCNSGYVFADAAEARACAESLDGPTVSEWAALAREHELIIVGGFCEDGGPVLRNSSVIVDGTGVRAVYRKAHLWDRESLVFDPGDERPPVIDTQHGRIATMVCYDLEFPEWVRLAALAGADLLCAPTNWPREPRPPDERPAEVVRVQAGASSNRMFIAACDRCGTERGVDWVTGTVIVGADGFPLAGPLCIDQPATILAECALGQARDKRTSERNDVFADRRPELYD